MKAVDTSVAVAAFGDWHRLNGAACAVLDQGALIPAHALLETYSVLTGFPPPYRAAPQIVVDWLENRFDEVIAPPDIAAHRELIRAVAAAGRAGGSIYDALVAMTANATGAVLITADRRAAAVYDLIGVEREFLV
jgi:predicted nucleic acid-binding protein